MHRATRPNNFWRAASMAGVLLCAIAQHAAAQSEVAEPALDMVQLRGGAEPIRGAITSIDAAGVTMRNFASGEESAITISLHTVRDIESDAHREDWQRFEPVAEKLWRAVSRVKRRDVALAEPLFDQLFDQYRGQTHETALVVAEGLLRCRLARAANEQAVLPWLEVARLRRAQVATTAFDELPDVIDAGTLLCPQLPPAWPAGNRAQRLRDDLAAYDAKDDSVIAALAALYGDFAALAMGEMVEPHDDKERPERPGVEILASLLSVRLSETDPSGISRAERRANEWPAWSQAWMRYHLGQSMLSHRNEPTRDLALVQLAHVPANHRFAQPYLAGLALAEMARAMESRGEPQHARALRRLVHDRYPGHPAGDSATRDATPERKTPP